MMFELVADERGTLGLSAAIEHQKEDQFHSYDAQGVSSTHDATKETRTLEALNA